MKLATTFQFTGDPAKTAQQVKDYESAGIDVVITPEIYGFDLVSTLGFLAGQTTTVELMSGIMPLYSRSPALIAQSASGIDALPLHPRPRHVGPAGHRGLARRAVQQADRHDP